MTRTEQLQQDLSRARDERAAERSRQAAAEALDLTVMPADDDALWMVDHILRAVEYVPRNDEAAARIARLLERGLVLKTEGRGYRITEAGAEAANLAWQASR